LSPCYIWNAAERSAPKTRFVLILVDVQKIVNGVSGKRPHGANAGEVLVRRQREKTDIIGWYLENRPAWSDWDRTRKGLERKSSRRDFWTSSGKFSSLHWESKRARPSRFRSTSFPEEYGSGANDHSANIKLYPEIQKAGGRKKSFRWRLSAPLIWPGALRRLYSFLPLFAAVAMAIKISSKGPVLFKQERLGQHGKTFNRIEVPFNEGRIAMQKFTNNMSSNSSPARWMAILEQPRSRCLRSRKDPRVTPIGRFYSARLAWMSCLNSGTCCGETCHWLARAPALAYEFRKYEVWHRRRVSGNQTRHYRFMAGGRTQPDPL